MARKPQVTRTIQTTRATILCFDIKKEESLNKEFVLPRVYKDNKHILKQVEAMLEDESIIPVHVVSATVEETLYGMSEQKFIEFAEILPPRKVYGDTDTAEDTND